MKELIDGQKIKCIDAENVIVTPLLEHNKEYTFKKYNDRKSGISTYETGNTLYLIERFELVVDKVSAKSKKLDVVKVKLIRML